MARSIIKFPNRKDTDFDKEFEALLDDMGGFIWHLKQATGMSWEALGAKCNLSTATLLKMADRDYKAGPTGRTIYKVLRALDDRGLIKHSMFMKYHGFGRKQAQVLDKMKADMDAAS